MGSNRTFMELKCRICKTPLLPKVCSNRTFMELKFTKLILLAWSRNCSNRTFMELKCSCFCNSIITL